MAMSLDSGDTPLVLLCPAWKKHETARAVMKEQGIKVDYLYGTMIEVPRAAVTADEIAQTAEFFSFGTNDLTQMTFGYSRDDINSFLPDYLKQDILERELNKLQVPGYSRFEVLNAGVGNYNTVQEVTHYLTFDRAFKPDLVILQYFINDAEPVPTERKLFLVGRSYLVAYTVSRFDSMLRLTGTRPNWKEYYASLYEDGRPGLEAAKQALAKLASRTNEDGTKLLVTILPELREINGEYPFAAAHQKIKDALSANHVPVLDLIDGLRGHGPESTLWVTKADDHPNGKANTLVAAQVLRWVVDTLLMGHN